MRHLRDYERVANREHFCDTCCNYINPGEMYEGEVLVDESRERFRVIILKRHVHPGCEPPEDPEEEREINQGLGNKVRSAA
jgi:hypothetical protein